MKKFMTVVMCVVMTFMLSACNLFAVSNLFVSSTGKKAFSEGKLSLAAGKYDEALSYFELARTEGDKSSEVESFINAINSYITARNYYNGGDYENAKSTIESMSVNGETQVMSNDVENLKRDIQNAIDSRAQIDEQIAGTEKLFANGDYAGVELNLKEMESKPGLSDAQREKLALIRQQLETANSKVKSASKTEVVYVNDADRESAKNAVTNFAYAYEAFVRNGSRNSDVYHSYMSAYSPSWSNAYKTQWNYFNKHSITSYYVDSLSFDSVTYDGNSFFVVDNETISETRDGKFTSTSTKWKYTVIKDGGVFKVTNYTKVK